MTSGIKLQACVVLVVVLLLPMAQAGAADASPSAQKTLVEFHSVLPLGEEPLILEPQHKFFAVFASAESPEFAALRVAPEGAHTELLRADGSVLQRFPATMSFRVTATSRVDGNITGDAPFPVSGSDLEPLLRSLRFRLKIFDGLQITSFTPVAVRMIGVPADVPYNERVYRVSFAIGDVPISQRMLLEVLGPDGERLCKFHLDLP
jgi:hypothetical protein